MCLQACFLFVYSRSTHTHSSIRFTLQAFALTCMDFIVQMNCPLCSSCFQRSSLSPSICHTHKQYITNPFFYTYDIKWWVSDNENVIDLFHETHYMTRAIFQLETRFTSFTVDVPQNINTEREKETFGMGRLSHLPIVK